jgi:hypothetical protein
MEPHELEALADRLAIEDLLTRYAHAVDRHDWDLYRSVFTDDAHIDYTSAGGIAGTLDEAVSFLEATMPIFEMTQHLVGNVDVRIEGDTATVSAMFNNPMRLPPRPGPHGRRLAEPEPARRVRLVRPGALLTHSRS